MVKLDLGLYVITASTPGLGRDHIDVAQAAIEGGATAIQLRVKRRSMGQTLKLAYAIRELTQEAGIPLFVNDHVGIAMASKAEGLHTGPDDMSLAAARMILGKSVILGRSTSGKPEEAIKAEKEGAGYVAVGPVFATSTKQTIKGEIGVSAITKVKKVVKIPVLAIGGINEGNLGSCIEAGADGVAVIAAVSMADDMLEATRKMRQALDESRATDNG